MPTASINQHHLEADSHAAKLEIAEACRKWRNEADLTTSRAAQVLGIPTRTLEGIEQGRGFRYPQLLMLAILAFK